VSPSLRAIVHLLFLLSGATALVYQVTWLRDLSLVFGASFEATSIVLAAFMAGLSAGGFAFARRAGRFARPFAVYGVLELGIAGFALAVPALLAGLDRAYVAAAAGSEVATPGLNALRVVLALAILFVPTFLMGGTLPVLTQGLVSRSGDFGVRLSWLYGINTLGAVAGAVGAGFFLIPAVGVWRSQLIAAAVNVAIGAAAIAASGAGARAAAAGPGGEAAEQVRPPPLTRAQRRAVRLAFWGTAVSGLCALALEVMWTRGIVIAVATTTYSFTVMLAAFLTGIWLGSWLHALFPLRRVDPTVQLGVVLCLIGVSSSAVSFWIPRLPELAIPLNLELYGLEPRIRGGTTLLLAFLVMLPSCILMGVAFPLTGEARARLQEGFGRAAGDALGLNTLGAIAGSLLAGFVLIPMLGLQRGMLAVSALYTIYGALVIAAAAWPARRAVALAAVAAAALAVLPPVLARPWDVSVLGSFQSDKVAHYLGGSGGAARALDVRREAAGWNVLYYREGRVSTVSVVDQGWDRTLIVDGKAVASDDPIDTHIQFLLGHVPVLLHPDPKRAVVVGMGTGMTLGAVTAHPGLEEIVLAEIEPAVLGARPYFARVNGDPLGDPRLHVVIQDGRNFLETTRRRFDVITADPIHPFARGTAYLYSAEYYEIAKSRLAEGGVMCQWLPLTGLSFDDVETIVRTFAEAFPHTSLWQTSHDVLLMGSLVPVGLSLPDLERRLAQPTVKRQLGPLGLDDGITFAAELGMDDAGVRRFGEGAPLNTDDNLNLEFSSPLYIGSGDPNRVARSIARARAELSARSTYPLPPLDPELAQRLAVARRAKSDTTMARVDESDAVRRLRQVIAAAPDYRPAKIQLARVLARLGSVELGRERLEPALRHANAAIRWEPEEASGHLVAGAVLARQGQYAPALEAIGRAIELRPDRWASHFERAKVLHAGGRDAEARAALREAIRLNPQRAELTAALADLDGDATAGG
jgi:spermidine synthase